MSEYLRSHPGEAGGLALVAGGALVGLAVYAGLSGIAGRGLQDAAAAAAGWGKVMLPPAMVAVGFVLILGRPKPEPARAAIGSGTILAAVCGILDAAHGAPRLDGPQAALRQAGGWLGAMVGGPLYDVVSGWGAGVVLVLVLVVGVLVLTGTSLRRAAQLVAVAAITAASVSRRLARACAAAVAAARQRSEAARTGTEAGSGDGSSAADADEDEYDAEVEDAEVEDGEEAPGAAVAPARAGPAPAAPATQAQAQGAQLPAGPGEQLMIDLGPGAQRGGPWKLPAVAVLKRSKAQEIDRKLVDSGGRALEEALAAHGVETRLVGATVGPTVTRYELELGPGVKVARVTSLHKDIAYAMASPDVRILAPIPGRSAIGVEVPNRQRQLVALADILVSEEARRAGHPLEVAMGRDIAGRAVMVNLAEMPHILIAGATGAGKSSCINSLVTSLLMRATPDQVRLILVDPKRVELGHYNGLPHLLTQVVVNPKKAANALAWAVHEMERRYDLLAECGVRDITGYNSAFDRGDLRPEPGSDREYPRLPFVLVVVDELNDLMMVAARDVEESICRIAQMARAVGIHLVIATQRPSVDVITGVIKANIPSRLAFSVSSLADSRVILDQSGAERLIGKGDMLLLSASSSIPRRLQGPWVSEAEVRSVVAHWRRQSQPQYVEGVEGEENLGGGGLGGGDDDDDDMLESAMELVVRSQLGSTSMLQRKLRVGFARAGRLMDLLERRGVVGPSEGSKARSVLMTTEELDETQRARSGSA